MKSGTVQSPWYHERPSMSNRSLRLYLMCLMMFDNIHRTSSSCPTILNIYSLHGIWSLSLFLRTSLTVNSILSWELLLSRVNDCNTISTKFSQSLLDNLIYETKTVKHVPLWLWVFLVHRTVSICVDPSLCRTSIWVYDWGLVHNIRIDNQYHGEVSCPTLLT